MLFINQLPTELLDRAKLYQSLRSSMFQSRVQGRGYFPEATHKCLDLLHTEPITASATDECPPCQ